MAVFIDTLQVLSLYKSLMKKSLIDKITNEDKTCALMGDFNIDLLKIDSNTDTNIFYNNLTSHFFAPFVLQQTRLSSKTLIDNIFLNTIEYSAYNGNLTVQLSDHLFQFIILEGFHKELKKQHI